MKAVFVIAAAAVMAAVFSHGAIAAPRPVLCKLVVNGKSYIDGQCNFEADKDGSFRIFGKDYFAYVTVTGKTAEASWNADPASRHAQAPLGPLTRKGACWESATVQICARDLPPDKMAAARAAQPRGEMIYPDYPGASQSCVMPRGMKWANGAPLVLGNCPGDKSANRFVRAGSEIRIDRAPGLCVGIARGARRATIELQACAETGGQWSSPATGTQSATIRSSTGECWTIPALDDDQAKFPFAIEADVCDKAGAKAIKFFFEKS